VSHLLFLKSYPEPKIGEETHVVDGKTKKMFTLEVEGSR